MASFRKSIVLGFSESVKHCFVGRVRFSSNDLRLIKIQGR